MQEIIKAHPGLSIIVFSCAAIAVIRAVGLALAKKGYASDIHVICYLFCLMSTCAFLALHWGTEIGAIDHHGAFLGRFGPDFNALFAYLLDLGTDLNIIYAIAFIVLAPQIANIVLAGSFGSAFAPVLVGRTISFVIWGAAKSFMSVAGALFSVALYGYFERWKGWDAEHAGSMGFLSLTLFGVSIGGLFVYRYASDIKDHVEQFWASKPLRAARKWLTRHAHKKPASPALVELRVSLSVGPVVFSNEPDKWFKWR